MHVQEQARLIRRVAELIVDENRTFEAEFKYAEVYCLNLIMQ